MIQIKDLYKTYKVKGHESVKALKGIDIDLPSTGMIFVLGKSGCGKTTLANIIGGLDKASSGQVIVDGIALQNFSGAQMDNYRSKTVGFIFQDYNLLDQFNVGQNIGLSLQLIGSIANKDAIDALLESVGLKGLAKRKISQLSGGQKQRVAIARAIAKDNKIIIADEPTGNLDSETSDGIFDILQQQSKTRLVIVVSHDVESAKKYADTIVTLKDGIVESDAINDNGIQQQETLEKLDTDGKIILNNKKSHISFKFILKFAVNTLFRHKVRLFFCILLPSIILTIFGVMYSSLDFSINRANIMDLRENSVKWGVVAHSAIYDMNFTSDDFGIYDGDDYSSIVRDLDKIKTRTDAFGMVYNLNHGINLALAWDDKIDDHTDVGTVWFYSSLVAVVLDDENISDQSLLQDMGYNLIHGRMPNAQDNEIVINENFFNMILRYGVRLAGSNTTMDVAVGSDSAKLNFLDFFLLPILQIH